MQVYADNAPILDRVWTRLHRRIDAYPPALRELARDFFAKAGPGYFSRPDAAPLLHLPIWLGRGVTPDALEDILEATALAYAYVRIQDNVVDEPDGRGHPPYLLMSNALLWDALALYRTHADAHFWDVARCAWFTFSEQTEAERRQLTGGGSYPHAAFVQHARKCALAEVPLYAVMGASGDWRGEAQVPKLVHALALSYGCVNDVWGHERDLLSGGRTWLLSHAREVAREAAGGEPSVEQVRRALVHTPIMEELVAQSIAELGRARTAAAALGVAHFDVFAAQRSVRLLHVQSRIAVLRLQAVLAA